MMSYNLMAWVIVNLLAVWYFRYLENRSNYLVSNAVQLMKNVRDKWHPKMSRSRHEKLQSMFNTARKVANEGLTYGLLALAGWVILLSLNTYLAVVTFELL